MIDLIEERTPLGRTACGSIVTLSEAATRFSNAEALVTETIAPWSDEHVRLFEASMAKLTRAVGSRPTILHRAFYAENRSAHPQINRALEHFYDLVAKALPHAVIVEVDESLRCAEDDHKWGSGPFHYIDDYYRTALAALRPCLKGTVADRVGFSLKGAAGG